MSSLHRTAMLIQSLYTRNQNCAKQIAKIFLSEMTSRRNIDSKRKKSEYYMKHRGYPYVTVIYCRNSILIEIGKQVAHFLRCGRPYYCLRRVSIKGALHGPDLGFRPHIPAIGHLIRMRLGNILLSHNFCEITHKTRISGHQHSSRSVDIS